MEAKAFLESYRNAFRKRKMLVTRIRDIEDRLLTVRSMDYAADRVVSSPDGEEIPDTIAALVDAQNDYIREEMESLKIQQEVSAVIEQLASDREREALFWRYIMCKKIDDIADKMYLTQRQIFRILAEAEMHVEGILNGEPEEEKDDEDDKMS